MTDEKNSSPGLDGFMHATGVKEERKYCKNCKKVFPVVPNDPEPKCPDCSSPAACDVPLGDSAEAVAARANLRPV